MDKGSDAMQTLSNLRFHFNNAFQGLYKQHETGKPITKIVRAIFEELCSHNTIEESLTTRSDV